MARHQPGPAFDDGRSLYSDGNIDRIGTDLSIGKKALDTIDLRSTLIATCLGVAHYLLAEMADRRKDAAHQMFARRARQYGPVRAYHRNQKVLGIYNRSIIRDKVGQFGRHKDEAIPTFLSRISIDSDHAELWSLGKAPGSRRSDVDRFLPLPLQLQVGGRFYLDGRHRKHEIACRQAATRGDDTNR